MTVNAALKIDSHWASKTWGPTPAAAGRCTAITSFAVQKGPLGIIARTCLLCHRHARLGCRRQVNVVRPNARGHRILELGRLGDALRGEITRVEWGGDQDVCVGQVPVHRTRAQLV